MSHFVSQRPFLPLPAVTSISCLISSEVLWLNLSPKVYIISFLFFFHLCWKRENVKVAYMAFLKLQLFVSKNAYLHSLPILLQTLQASWGLKYVKKNKNNIFRSLIAVRNKLVWIMAHRLSLLPWIPEGVGLNQTKATLVWSLKVVQVLL